MANLSYTAGSGELKNWVVAENVFDAERLGKCEAIFCQGNGYVCVRNALEERYLFEKRNMFVTGTFNKFDDGEVTELPNLPDMTNLVLRVNGQRFSLEQGTVQEYSRALNLKTGETTRRVRWVAPGGEELELQFCRFVSLQNEHLFAEQITVRSLNGKVTLQVESGIDGRQTNTGSQHFHEGAMRLYDKTDLETISETIQSKVLAALHCATLFFKDDVSIQPEVLPVIDRRSLSIRTRIEVDAGDTLTIEKFCSVHTSRDLAYEALTEREEIFCALQKDGLAVLRSAKAEGYRQLLASSTAGWAEYWQKHDILIESDHEFDQLATRFALYHLNIMVKRDDSRVGIGAKGMSGEGYKGHSFWDTEIFILPHFTLTDPATARTLLEYRYKSLYGAHLKAKEYGYEGAMYPWECAWIDDGEVTPILGAADVVTGKPMPILTGMIEHHISADIAFAVWQYYSATGDEAFMLRCGNEIILDTARFWCSRVTMDEAKGQYVINDVIGPDEYKEHVNNNAYTNYLAAHNLKLAKKIIATLRNEPQEFAALDSKLDLNRLEKNCSHVLENLYLPQPREDGIVEQFEGYFRLRHIDLTKYKQSSVVGTIYEDYNMEQINELQVSKQADLVILLFLLDDLFPQELKLKNYHFYEERTLHDSSLSKSTHSVLAQDLGDEQTAYSLFEGACRVDLGEEMRSSDMGIHSAAMGGIWQCVVYGFGGVRIVGNELHIAPKLPKTWRHLAFSVMWRGCELAVDATAEQTQVTNRGATETSIRLNGTMTVIAAGETVSVASAKQA